MKQAYNKKSGQIREIARERIIELFEQAELRFKKQPFLSDRYVEIARKISMKYKIRIPSELKKRFCKHCHKYIVPSVNCRVRLTGKKVVYYCMACRHFMRFPYS
jgi:ribonuclease P protein subunit RPR2